MDEDELKLLYQAIKNKKDNKQFESKSNKNSNLNDYLNTPIEQEDAQEKQKIKLVQKRNAGSSNDSSYGRLLHQPKHTKIVNLKFIENYQREPDNFKKRPSTSLNRKNFREFVVSQSKKVQF